MITKDIILCKCHRQPVNTKVVKRKPSDDWFPFNKRKYYCSVTGQQLFNNFIHEKAKVNLPDPDDTWDGSEVECPEDLEKAYEDYKKKQGGDE